jgi:PTH1 family peptidyl-tRNA hydrolase
LASPEGTALVLGLGNPGPRYQGTRHNAGAAAVAELARRAGLALTRQSLASLWAKGRVADRAAILALPQTYMNRSGQAAASLSHYFKLGPESLVVVHDDLDLELGRLKVARKGSAAGHKGVASVMQHLGTAEFARLKLGIGRPRHDEPIERYVLEGFYADQREMVDKAVGMAVDCLEVILSQGVEAAMQRFHSPLKEEVEG